MPGTFVVDVKRRVVFVRYWGVVSEADLFSTGRAANTDEQVKDGFDRLISLADVTDMAISSPGIRKLADVARGFSVRRRALVATKPVTFGIARMWEQNLLLPDGTSQVFDNLPDALDFLGLDRGTPWPAGA